MKTNRRVSKLMAKWKQRLGLQEWAVHVTYPPADLDPEQDGMILCTCHASVPYLRLHVSVFPSWFQSSPDMQEEAIAHELAHALVQPVADMMDGLTQGALFPPHVQQAAVEQLTQRITKIAGGRAQ